MQENIRIKEKRHRLPGEFYKGRISVAFTLCLKRRLKPAATQDTQNIRKFAGPGIVSAFINILNSVAVQTNCIVPVYCFMPDHQHLIITGISSESDIWKAIVAYKQKTGFWMSKNETPFRWQKDFYDHVIRRHEDVGKHGRYILDNPIRKELVSAWNDYPFKGSVGCQLNDILNGIIL